MTETARLDLDKELTSMTTRYRKLEMEFDDIKVQLKRTIEEGRNYTNEGERQLLSMTKDVQKFASSFSNDINYLQRNVSQGYKQLLSMIKDMQAHASSSSNDIKNLQRNLSQIAVNGSKGLSYITITSLISSPNKKKRKILD